MSLGDKGRTCTAFPFSQNIHTLPFNTEGAYSMPILRVEKNRNYSVISNVHLQDDSLSWKAKGLLSYLLSLPDTWQIYLEHLKNQSTDGRDSTRTGIKELLDKGYITRDFTRNDAGQIIGRDYIVREQPIADKPTSDKPTSDNPILDNPTVVNTDNINNGLKEKTTTATPPPPPFPLPEKYNTAVIQALILKALSIYSEDYIKEAISYAVDTSTGNTVQKFKAYLDKTIANGWGVGYQSEKIKGQEHDVEHFKKMPLKSLEMLAAAKNIYAIRELEKRSG